MRAWEAAADPQRWPSYWGIRPSRTQRRTVAGETPACSAIAPSVSPSWPGSPLAPDEARG